MLLGDDPFHHTIVVDDLVDVLGDLRDPLDRGLVDLEVDEACLLRIGTADKADVSIGTDTAVHANGTIGIELRSHVLADIAALEPDREVHEGRRDTVVARLGWSRDEVDTGDLAHGKHVLEVILESHLVVHQDTPDGEVRWNNGDVEAHPLIGNRERRRRHVGSWLVAFAKVIFHFSKKKLINFIHL